MRREDVLTPEEKNDIEECIKDFRDGKTVKLEHFKR
jgi:hypothetical protein